MGLDARKPVFRDHPDGNQVRVKPACSTTETSISIEILDVASLDITMYTLKAVKNKGSYQTLQAGLGLKKIWFSHKEAHV